MQVAYICNVIFKSKYIKKMKLTKKALGIVSKDNGIKAKLCATLDASYFTMQRWLNENKDDSRLTTVAAINLIKEETGLTQEEIIA